jgi:hypothetical protein
LHSKLNSYCAWEVPVSHRHEGLMFQNPYITPPPLINSKWSGPKKLLKLLNFLSDTLPVRWAVRGIMLYFNLTWRMFRFVCKCWWIKIHKLSMFHLPVMFYCTFRHDWPSS